MASPSPLRRPSGSRSSLQDQVVEAMRLEIQEQGALLALFEDQQQAIVRREAERVLMLVDAIQKQVDSVQQIRSRREALMAQAIARARIPRDTPLLEVVARFTPVAQPLLRALVDEVIRVAEQVRRKANQNQILLARSIEVIRELLEELSPANPARTYEQDGRVKISLSGTGAAYRT